MITPKEYFENYLSWKRSDSGLRSAKSTYAPFSALDLESLTAEAEAGSPGAQEELGERYLFGLSDLKADPQKAKEIRASPTPCICSLRSIAPQNTVCSTMSSILPCW